MKQLYELLKNGYVLPEVTSDIPHGDMPGDKIAIDEGHIQKATTIFPLLLEELRQIADRGGQKAVVCVCGGSGVGKSEIASILGYYLEAVGIGAYVLSGDNYPHRIPLYNDAERLHIFRESAIRGMIKEGVYQEAYFQEIRQWQEEFTDADKSHIDGHPWFEAYIKHGRKGLAGYLGTEKEIDFDEVSDILRRFHEGERDLFLKRMGRTDTELWYESVDMSRKEVLLLEWTHGNNDLLQGVDIPILLNSTPEETLAHRRARNRDGQTDSAFTTMVLEIEQNLLRSQAHKAHIILAKSGALLSLEELGQLDS